MRAYQPGRQRGRPSEDDLPAELQEDKDRVESLPGFWPGRIEGCKTREGFEGMPGVPPDAGLQ